MTTASIKPATSDTSNAPVRVATDQEILTSPTEMLVTLDQINSPLEVGRTEWVYVTLMDGVIDLDTISYDSDLHHKNVGTKYMTASGREATLLGVYVVCGVAGQLIFLRLMSDRACTEYAWCRGHEDEGRDVPRHVDEDFEVFKFDGDDRHNRAHIVATPFVEEGDKHWHVFMEYDLELNASEMLKLATQLEAAARQIRGI